MITIIVEKDLLIGLYGIVDMPINKAANDEKIKTIEFV